MMTTRHLPECPGGGCYCDQIQRASGDVLLAVILDDLDARIQREIEEGDGDGLLDGIKYARRMIAEHKFDRP